MAITEYFGLLISVGILCFMIFLVVNTGREHDDFKKNGIRTVATVTKIKQIGSSGAGSPKCVISLTFHSQEGEKITTEKTEVISALNLMPIERDRKVDIYYKKDKPQKVWLILQSQKDRESL
ncbi:hypothetical protein ACU9CO_004220 [Cronobacter dublinensis]